MRIVFMGTPQFAVPVLEALVEGGYEVAGVYTRADKPAGRGRAVVHSPVKERALAYGLAVHQPRSLRTPEERDRLMSLAPEAVVVAAYGQLLPQEILDIPPLGCINVHPSLLPRHRGASPIAGAILSGDEVTGVSIMLLDKGMDTGPVLSRATVPVMEKDNTGTLTARLSRTGAQLLMETLPRWAAGKLSPQPQDEEQATYTQPISKESGRIDWTLPAVEIWCRVRAYNPWPGSFTAWQGKTLKIIEAVPLPGRGPAGKVVAARQGDAAPVAVYAGEGMLGILQLQLEGKRVMAAGDFLRGQRGFIDSTLPS